MAFTLIRTKQGTNTSTSTLVIGSATNFRAGNLVVVFIRAISGTANISSIVDDVGNTYSLASGPLTGLNNDIRIWVYYSIQTIDLGTTVTVTYDAVVSSSYGVASEFNGGGPFDKASTGQATSGTTGSVTSFSPTNASGELIFAGVSLRSGTTGTVAADASYTGIVSNNAVGTEYKSDSSASETAPFTWTTSVFWDEIAAAFFSTSTSTSSTSSSTSSTSSSSSSSTSSSSTSSSISTSSTSSSTSSTSTSTSSTSMSTSTTTRIVWGVVPRINISKKR